MTTQRYFYIFVLANHSENRINVANVSILSAQRTENKNVDPQYTQARHFAKRAARALL